MSRFLILIEETDTGFSAHSPDLPGCIATGESLDAVKDNIREAIAFHIEGLRAEGLEVPSSSSMLDYVEVSS